MSASQVSVDAENERVRLLKMIERKKEQLDLLTDSSKIIRLSGEINDLKKQAGLPLSEW